jgi:hypothetical protein
MNEQIKAGADIHAGDGGYSEGTREAYEAFVKERNYSIGKARIKMLAEQSELNLELQSLKVEKFAELIVRECVNVADEVSMDDTIGYALLEHFGVEE